jgi:hypothetical protein
MVNYISIIIAMAMSPMTNLFGDAPNLVNSSWTRVNENNKNNFIKSPLIYSITK